MIKVKRFEQAEANVRLGLGKANDDGVELDPKHFL